MMPNANAGPAVSNASATLAGLAGFPGAAEYRAYAEAMAAFSRRKDAQEYGPGELSAVQVEGAAGAYAAGALVALGLAARILYDTPTQRGRAASLLGALLADDGDGCHYTISVDTLRAHLRLLPSDAVCGIFRSAVRGCASGGLPHVEGGYWKRGPSPELQNAVRYARRHLTAALASRAWDVDAIRASLLALPALDRIELVTSFCSECGADDSDRPHSAWEGPEPCPCVPIR
jgi:hypothetical protein